MKPTLLILATLITLPTLAGAFTVKMSNSVLDSQGSLRISVAEGAEGPAQAVIRDSAGSQVAALQPISAQDLVWDGRDMSGRKVQPGSYFVEVESGAHMWASVVSVRP